MKYFSVIVFLAAMNWTWGLSTRTPAISEEVHVEIQEGLKAIISEYIEQHLPNSTNLVFDRFWTEAITDTKVKVSFLYSFDDANNEVGEARVHIEGYANFNRNNDKPGSIGSFDELVVSNNQVEYKQPIKITPNNKEDQAPEDSGKDE